MPVCPSCGALQPGGANFCDECGAGLEVAAAFPLAAAPAPVTVLICSSCYAQLEPVSRFCHMCGRPVRAATPPAPSPTSKPTSPIRPPSGAPAPSPAHPPGAAVQGHLVVHGTNAILPLPPGKTQAIIGREDPVSGIFPDIDLVQAVIRNLVFKKDLFLFTYFQGNLLLCYSFVINKKGQFVRL